MRIYPSDLIRMRERAKKIVMLTAYDYPFASLLDAAGADVLLVGDSLGTVVQGNDSTLPVTLDDIIYHSRMVVRGAKRALVVADMPFMSYQLSPEQALESAGRVMKEAGVGAVKLEGGVSQKETVRRLVEVGIPVMGHVGLLPQSVHVMGGYKVQGRGEENAERVLNDALALEEAGAFSVVLEGIPADLATSITAALKIPTIGIGASVNCSGQVLVIHDLLRLKPQGEDTAAKFVREYADLQTIITDAVSAYARDVREERFPAVEHTYSSAPLKNVKLG